MIGNKHKTLLASVGDTYRLFVPAIGVVALLAVVGIICLLFDKGLFAFVCIAGACGISVALLFGRKLYNEELRSEIKGIIHQYLKKVGLKAFTLGEAVRGIDVPYEHVRKACLDIYKTFTREALKDFVMTEKEQQALSLLAKKLEISTDFASEIERSLKGKAYSKALQTKLSDGALTKKEKYELQEIRNMLGLKESQVREATKDSAIEAYRVIFRRFSENGLLNAVELDELKDLERSTNLTPAEAANISPDDAITLYRRTVSIVCQDGIVTAEEQKLIDALEYLLQLPKKLTAPLKEQIEMVRELHQLRSGKLPVIRKDGLHLKSTELCHWYSSCCYQYKTPTRLIELYGNLIVTNRRVIFSSPERGIEFSIKKILNIYNGSDGVQLNLTSTRGQGVYLVDNAEKLAAIMEALVRHHNFLMAERLDSARCRHIPDDVKVAVWQRDGGGCVKCKAIDYMEFDHIIPFSKGGANTVGNIQLLCRRCNLAKGGELF